MNIILTFRHYARFRKVKCDETKPFCHRCVSTGRACDGYESPFRIFTSKIVIIARASGIKSGASLQPAWPIISLEIGPQDIDLLSRCFSTKTIFDVKLGCDEEARKILEAGLSNPPIRYAVSSLRALREDLEKTGDVPASVEHQTPSYDFGVRQYCIALSGLASTLSSPSSNGLRSALLCCQIFISIEQLRGNYAAMVQHIIQGLRIMHQYRARPTLLVTAKKYAPAHHAQLPFLDVFIIKLFAAPCKFADPPPPPAEAGGKPASACTSLVLPRQLPLGPSHHRTIVPDRRMELTRIATWTLVFLGKVSRGESAERALRLLPEKAFLLGSLESWLADMELEDTEIKPPSPELISVSFLRFFHQILRIVLLGALDCSPDLSAGMQTEYDKLQGIASIVGERVNAYRWYIGIGSGRGL